MYILPNLGILVSDAKNNGYYSILVPPLAGPEVWFKTKSIICQKNIRHAWSYLGCFVYNLVQEH